MYIRRAIILVIDACGVGALPDAAAYDDVGAATVPHCAAAVGGLDLPNCRRLGLGNIVPIAGVPPVAAPAAAFGKMAEQSAGKDSTAGHWEIAGLITPVPFPTYPHGFPPSLVREFELQAGVRTIGNIPASGTAIIEQFGEEHLRSGAVILYTSADSVWQMAAHEERYPLAEQYRYCEAARELLTGEHAVARVIARPFIGSPGRFVRTAGRRDFSLPPGGPTLLDLMVAAGRPTYAVGKIWDLFAARGITSHVKPEGNAAGMEATIELVRGDRDHGLIFTNLVDFDQAWGHRRDPANFALALEDFDRRLGALLDALREDDMLIITADHGCDPTLARHTDHTREYVPLLAYGRRVKAGVNLGARATFADVGATVAELFRLPGSLAGNSFAGEVGLR
ncbi:MAG TPA: phosphopentomutase [candidate division Zixibacteria bacterium]|nr:phosphopentomutase [candidate division Zixibacteria bacterium]MDD4917239.1 phosphopentomutase [candidate division Zixibacteria bacterium]MDM7971705.1 phosphopentomutase [candidate division Zixibacteria bacterium]HOD65901.1 phosphopentomutase [candidate division Zixibacteria bacterium]HOZ07872.1 phosphopentomutase [candidate division Zixibacteria bacterium]